MGVFWLSEVENGYFVRKSLMKLLHCAIVYIISKSFVNTCKRHAKLAM
jgi:hypothetical protein